MKTIFAFASLLFVLVLSYPCNAQNVTVSGFITNSNNGEVLENVNVFESVSTIGTLSDKHGFYKLMLKKGEAKILVSYTGYSDISKKLMIENDTTINIRLIPVTFLKSKQKTDEQAQHVNANKQEPKQPKTDK